MFVDYYTVTAIKYIFESFVFLCDIVICHSYLSWTVADAHVFRVKAPMFDQITGLDLFMWYWPTLWKSSNIGYKALQGWVIRYLKRKDFHGCLFFLTFRSLKKHFKAHFKLVQTISQFSTNTIYTMVLLFREPINTREPNQTLSAVVKHRTCNISETTLSQSKTPRTKMRQADIREAIKQNTPASKPRQHPSQITTAQRQTFQPRRR